MPAPITVYEYLILEWDGKRAADELTETLNSYGAQGWRLIDIYDVGQRRAIFIREAQATVASLPANASP